jgi:hypothetical protein
MKSPELGNEWLEKRAMNNFGESWDDNGRKKDGI